jgi:hypothetical protein
LHIFFTIRRKFRANFLLLALLTLAIACSKTDLSDPVPALVATNANCIEGGKLSVETYGAFETKIDWVAESMTCEGMRRPNSEGARLRFAGQVGEKDARQHVAFILSIPDLKQGSAGKELPTRVTIIEEDAGRFFSTQESAVCWTNIDSQEARSDYQGVTMPGHYEISGLLYCVSPVAELNGSSSITLSDLVFHGSLSWTGG